MPTDSITFKELGLPENLFRCRRQSWDDNDAYWFELWDKDSGEKTGVSLKELVEPLLGYDAPIDSLNSHDILSALIRKVKGEEEAERDYRYFYPPVRDAYMASYPKEMHPLTTDLSQELRPQYRKTM